MLGAGEYLLGVALLGIAALSAGAAATRVRSRLLPGWTGPPAWLADVLLAAALLIWVAQLLGSAGALHPAAFVAAIAIAALAIRGLVGPGPGAGRRGPQAAPAHWGPARWAAIAVCGLLVAHWSIGVRVVLDTGITNFDTTWYHGPFAAGFAQGSSTLDLQLIAPQFLAWFYPQNSELLHGLGILVFDRDNLSPLVNLAWLGGTLLAAWCIGRPYGVAPLSLIGAAVVLDSGALADQAGSMRNDMPAIFFLTAAAAIAVSARAAGPQRPHAGRRASGIGSGALALTGLAAGLAAGVKLNYLVPAAALAAGLALASAPGARRRAAALVGLPLLAGCGYWYLRNLIHSGNPLPWVKSLGPLGLPGPGQELGGRRQESVLGYALEPSTWSDWFLPGFHDGLGWAWPAVLGLALLALAACAAIRRDRLLVVLGATGLLAAVAWIANPASAAGPAGEPLSFESGLRYLAPALVLGLALLPVAAGAERPIRRSVVLAALLVLLAFSDASGGPWYSGYVAGAVAAGAVAAGAIALGGSWRLRRASRGALVAAAAAIAVLAVGAGWLEQRRYLDHRYAESRFAAPGLNAAFEWARGLERVRIATTATRQYPLWGTELSNEVSFAGVDRPRGGFVKASSCAEWRRLLDEGGFDYVVASRDRVEPGRQPFPTEAGWTRDPNASVILRRAPTVVFRLDGPLAPSRCR